MKTKGFTLIELLLVIAIISLLSSVVLASLKDARTKAVSTALISEIRSLFQESEIYFAGNNQYSSTEQAADSSVACPTTLNSDWGFFGTQKGIELTTSIKKRLGNGNLYCKINQQSWAIFGPSYVPLLVQETTNTKTAYAQSSPVYGFICVDSETRSIKTDIIASNNPDDYDDRDEDNLSVNYPTKGVDGKFRCQ